MVALDVALYVVGIDFTVSGMGDMTDTPSADDERSVKVDNERMLASIVEATPKGALLPSSDLVKLMSQLQTRSVRATKNKCVFEIGTL